MLHKLLLGLEAMPVTEGYTATLTGYKLDYSVAIDSSKSDSDTCLQAYAGAHLSV